MRRPILWLSVVPALAGITACARAQSDLPTGPVVDTAGIIADAPERSLDDRLRAFYVRTCRAVVVATVPSLEGKTIESYAKATFNRWGIGDAQRGDGVLLLVAPTERKVRIEVGLGLERTLTDDEAATIIAQDMTPSYRDGRYADGIAQGVGAIFAQLDQPATAPCTGKAA